MTVCHTKWDLVNATIDVLFLFVELALKRIFNLDSWVWLFLTVRIWKRQDKMVNKIVMNGEEKMTFNSTQTLSPVNAIAHYIVENDINAPLKLSKNSCIEKDKCSYFKRMEYTLMECESIKLSKDIYCSVDVVRKSSNSRVELNETTMIQIHSHAKTTQELASFLKQMVLDYENEKCMYVDDRNQYYFVAQFQTLMPRKSGDMVKHLLCMEKYLFNSSKTFDNLFFPENSVYWTGWKSFRIPLTMNMLGFHICLDFCSVDNQALEKQVVLKRSRITLKDICWKFLYNAWKHMDS